MNLLEKTMCGKQSWTWGPHAHMWETLLWTLRGPHRLVLELMEERHYRISIETFWRRKKLVLKDFDKTTVEPDVINVLEHLHTFAALFSHADHQPIRYLQRTPEWRPVVKIAGIFRGII